MKDFPLWITVSIDSKTNIFSDIDECSKENRATLSGCQAYCMNFAGGYRCACAPPKILESNNKTCSGDHFHSDFQTSHF